MRNIFINTSIKLKLGILVAVPLAGFLAYAIFTQLLIGRIRVNGPVYQEIVMNKDLVADILPPPEYIIEAYLTTLLIHEETDPEILNGLIERCSFLKKEYDERHEVWIKSLPEGKMRQEMTQASYDPAIEFYSLLDSAFLPAVRQGDSTLADDLLNGKLKQAYAKHRAAIDRVVEMALKESSDLEIHAQKTLKTSSIITITFAAVLIVIVLLLGVVIVKTISEALLRLLERIKDIVNGEGDLRMRIENNSTDEIGQIAKWFNALLEKLQGVIQQIVASTSTLSSSSEELSAVSTQIASGAEELTMQSNTVASATEEATVNVNSISASTEEMSTGVSTVATAIEEMSSSLNEVAKNCQNELRIADEANAQTNSTRDLMERLGTSSKDIGQVIEVINDIADQTNLLALNATIEAASAGDAGKGFAVVASEVKELAKQTAQATSQIGHRIEEMQNNTTSAISAIVGIAKTIEDINSISHTIVSTVEEQSATVNEISRNIAGTSQAANEVARNVNESAKGLSEVSSNIHEVNKITGETTGGISNIRKSIQELSILANDLQKIVVQFKV